jgi:hypothetical protein
MGLKGRAQLMSKVRRRQDQLCRAIALEGLARLIRRTPVDKGTARANWNCAKGAADRANDPARDRSDIGPNQAEGAKVIASFGSGDALFVTNSLEYIPELEKGSSKQAPNGMVAITAAEMQLIASRAVAQIAHGE